jgi:Uma2 family endonuclease
VAAFVKGSIGFGFPTAVLVLIIPVVLTDDSEPEPDLMVLRRRAAQPYKEREAHAAGVLLVIEVADTSLAYDRSIKQRLYAEAGVPEYWIIDCEAEAVEIYRDPGAEGYRDVRRVGGQAVLALQAFADIQLAVPDIFV